MKLYVDVKTVYSDYFSIATLNVTSVDREKLTQGNDLYHLSRIAL